MKNDHGEKIGPVVIAFLVGLGVFTGYQWGIHSIQNSQEVLLRHNRQCQDDFVKWKNESSSNTYGFRAYFNVVLNTCLVDYMFSRPDGYITEKVIDIYDANKIILEYDYDPSIPSKSGIPNPAFSENGKIINSTDPYTDYERKLNALFTQ